MNKIASQPDKQSSVEELLQSVEAGFNVQAIELALPPSTHSSRLYKFYHKLEEELNNLGSNGFISHVQHSRSRGTTFTVKLVPAKDSEFLETLNNMPEVEEVTEESKGDYAYPDLSHKFNVLLAQ
jgi:hypothetical protein